MFDPKLISILEYLYPYGLENKQEINDLLNSLFPIPTNVPEHEFNGERWYLIRFLERINKVDSPYNSRAKDGYIKFEPVFLNNVNDFRSKPDKWFNQQFKASITEDGLKELARQKEFNEQSLVSKSIIETNHSVKETNKSILEISDKQAASNETIATNSKSQTDILRNQRWILYVSVFISICSVLVSYLTYKKDVPNNQLKQELKTTNRRLDTIQRELFQIKSDTSPRKEAKKILPKKF